MEGSALCQHLSLHIASNRLSFSALRVLSSPRRGNRRATIFHDDTDYRAYLERLERYRHHDGVTLHAYILMLNHLHLLLEIADRPLARTMQTLQCAYSQSYNRRYGK
ncbi:MAG: hypothetical protein CV088_18220 [Nitrospira sp. LK70]|nr:hypothetical protein [Nitrospira sp. LK70]